jgi:hypothetical protein
MTAIKLDEDRLNLEIRKFLKQVGVTSQREIEMAVRSAAESGELSGAGPLDARMTLTIPALGLEHVVEHAFSIGQAEG